MKTATKIFQELHDAISQFSSAGPEDMCTFKRIISDANETAFLEFQLLDLENEKERSKTKKELEGLIKQINKLSNMAEKIGG